MSDVKYSDSLFLRTCRGESCGQTPVWLMRQAGRYLPEYRELRKNYNMMKMFTTPELAAEVTLQPIRRYQFDAAIIFADILTPLTAMGVELDFVEGVGPVINNQIKSAADVQRLIVPEQVAGDFTLDAIKLSCQELAGSRTPLIGFAGGPFTLSCYLLECGSADRGGKTKDFYSSNPEAWHQMQEKLVLMLEEYLVAQVEAGVSVLQIFESWLGSVSPQQYAQFVQPYLEKLVNNLKKRVSVPIIFFSTGTSALFPQFKTLAVDVYGVDWRCDLSQANQLLGGNKVLQGNLDPQVLAANGDLWKSEVRNIMQQGRELPAHIFNLGHGILPHTPIERVSELLALIRS